MKLIYLLPILLLVVGCLGLNLTKLSDIKADQGKYAGTDVTVKGTVEKSVKIGQLSAFSLSDGGTTMGVSSEMLPPVGKNVTVSGTVVKDTVFGYYILAKEVRIE
jgi:hypothetical protein